MMVQFTPDQLDMLRELVDSELRSMRKLHRVAPTVPYYALRVEILVALRAALDG